MFFHRCGFASVAVSAQCGCLFSFFCERDWIWNQKSLLWYLIRCRGDFAGLSSSSTTWSLALLVVRACAFCSCIFLFAGTIQCIFLNLGFGLHWRHEVIVWAALMSDLKCYLWARTLAKQNRGHFWHSSKWWPGACTTSDTTSTTQAHKDLQGSWLVSIQLSHKTGKEPESRVRSVWPAANYCKDFDHANHDKSNCLECVGTYA